MASNESDPYSFPPGLLGDMANAILWAAPRPVPEMALAAAIAFMAGMCGRAFNVSKTGLNLYTVVLAPTGTGKEGMQSGINMLAAAVRKAGVPAIDDFIGPAEIASPQALIKHLAKAPHSFLSVFGEFGMKMQQMANPKGPAHITGLLKPYLDLFHKSGANDYLRPIIYSDKDKNTPTIQAPSFSLLGESVPEKFYEGLGEGLITSGLLSRFLFIEYNGPRIGLQYERIEAPDERTTKLLAELCAYSLALNSQGKVQTVALDPNAESIFDAFEDECTDEINKSASEITRHLWNRSHIRALRLAALASIGWAGPYNPIIGEDAAQWAINIERASVRLILSRFEAGEVGEGSTEELRIKRTIEAIKSYVQRPWSELRSYGVRGDLHERRIIPYSYLQIKLSSTAPFKKQNFQEPTKLIQAALKTLCERGDLQEVSPAVLSKEYEFNGKAYMVSNPKTFGLGLSD